MKRYLAEFLVAFFLVFAGVGAIVSDAFLSTVRAVEAIGFVGIALAHGLALALAIAAVGRISGGYGNPAVSIALWISRRMKFTDMLGYIAAQLLGGVAAAFFVKRVFPKDAFQFAAGNPALGPGINAFNGTAVELVLTFFLVLVIWGVAVDKRGPRALAPFAIGLTVTFDILAGGPLSGAAMNPARWFGPALAAGQLGENWYVWIAGPILGALLASLLYETFFLDPEDEVAEGDVVAFDEDELEDDEESVAVVPGTTSSYGQTGVGVTTPTTVTTEAPASTSGSEWRDTPSSYTPPSPPDAPPSTGTASPMTPPPPGDDDEPKSTSF